MNDWVHFITIIKPVCKGFSMTMIIQSFIHDLIYTISTKETCFQDFLVAFASELLENNEDIFLRYYMHSDVFSRFKCSTIEMTPFQYYEKVGNHVMFSLD